MAKRLSVEKQQHTRNSADHLSHILRPKAAALAYSCFPLELRHSSVEEGKAGTYWSRLTGLELTIFFQRIEILFSKTTYSIGHSLMQPYLM